MLYLSIDQHAKQLTVSLRDEDGNVLDRRQVSTEPKRVRAYFEELKLWGRAAGGYMAILEVLRVQRLAQASPRREDCAGGRDATAGHDLLAHADASGRSGGETRTSRRGCPQDR